MADSQKANDAWPPEEEGTRLDPGAGGRWVA